MTRHVRGRGRGSRGRQGVREDKDIILLPVQIVYRQRSTWRQRSPSPIT
jgi:hypothetical protein